MGNIGGRLRLNGVSLSGSKCLWMMLLLAQYHGTSEISVCLRWKVKINAGKSKVVVFERM